MVYVVLYVDRNVHIGYRINTVSGVGVNALDVRHRSACVSRSNSGYKINSTRRMNGDISSIASGTNGDFGFGSGASGSNKIYARGGIDISISVDVGVGVQFDSTHEYSVSRSNNS